MKSPKCINKNSKTQNWQNSDCVLNESPDDDNKLLCVCSSLSPTTIIDDIDDVFKIVEDQVSKL